jgi:hypothetical protein
VRFSAPVQTGFGAHTASCTMGTVSFRGVKSGWGVTLTPHPRLVPWSSKGRAIHVPLLPLWAVRPVQSLSARTRVHFTFLIGPHHDAHPSPRLVPWSRKCRSMPLLPLWALRPVQSLNACWLLRSWLWHCCTCRKFAVSIPNGVNGIFH